MTDSPPAEVVPPADDLDATIVFFTETLGFSLDAVFPADDPAVAVVAGHHLRIRLDRETDVGSGLVRIPYQPSRGAGGRRPADGTERDPDRVCPRRSAGRDPSAGPRVRTDARWGQPPRTSGHAVPGPDTRPTGWSLHRLAHRRAPGRARERLRALPPGAVQVICCVRGWVKVVYEDQGPPFVLEPGDCVLQPPEIRHRVLESSEGLEVVEVTCPAAHETLTDPDLTLPTSSLNPVGTSAANASFATTPTTPPGRRGFIFTHCDLIVETRGFRLKIEYLVCTILTNPQASIIRLRKLFKW